MKKFVAFLTAVVMMATLALSVCAVEFVPSIEIKKAPTVISAVDENGNSYLIVLTPLVDTETLDEDAKNQLLGAYDKLKEEQDIITLSEELKKIAENKKIPAKNLIVKDLFDISIEGEFKGNVITITLTADQLTNFVGLMHYQDGKWTLIDDAKVVNGNQLTFSKDALGATGSIGSFAIIVDSGAPTSPETGVQLPFALIAVAVMFAGAAVVFFVKSKKVTE